MKILLIALLFQIYQGIKNFQNSKKGYITGKSWNSSPILKLTYLSTWLRHLVIRNLLILQAYT